MQMRVFDNIGRHPTSVIGTVIAVCICFAVLFWKQNANKSVITVANERKAANTSAISSQALSSEATTQVALPSDEEAAAQKELLRREEHEKQKKEWMKSIGMENEGTKPVDAQLRAIAGTLAQYHQAYGEYPQGEGKEVAAALLGRVPGKKAFLEWNTKKISPNGELLDPWGSPYFIKIIGEKIELRSAGPDHLFWNADDLFLK